jgi:ABC-type multidrug transport system ATPase subunit
MNVQPDAPTALARRGPDPACAGIIVDGVRKSFGTVTAVRGVDLRVPPGSIVALLGPNGAGKTTLVRIITTLTPPDAGTVSIGGHDIATDPAAARAAVALVAQHVRTDPYLTGREYLTMIARLRGFPRDAARRRADDLLARLELQAVADRRIATHSGGTQRRLALAAGLTGDPAVMVLDEPTTGVDPASRLALWAQIAELRDRGVAVLLTTQQLDEADRVADTVVIIDRGRIVAEDTPDNLKSRLAFDVITIQVPPEAVRSAIATLSSPAEQEVEPTSFDGVIRVRVGAGRPAVAEIVRRLDQAGIPTLGIEVRRPTLDDAFVALTGQAADHPDSGPDDGDHTPPRRSLHDRSAHRHGGHR